MGGPRKNNKTNAAPASPSGATSDTSSTMEDLMAQMNIKLTSLVEEVRNLGTALKAEKQKNEQLKETVQNQADEIAELRQEINDRELHARSWSIRVINVPIPAGQETNNRVVMDTVYKELVVPILEGVRASGEITTIPPCDNIIEIAHILPGKTAKKPIIVRFHSRYWRSLLFRHRKNFAPREEAASTTGNRPPRMKYPFFEDLTRATFKQLKTIQADERVTSAWTVSGVIRFKVDGDDTVYKISSIYDTVDDTIE
jgi:hypothetical protein